MYKIRLASKIQISEGFPKAEFQPADIRFLILLSIFILGKNHTNGEFDDIKTHIECIINVQWRTQGDPLSFLSLIVFCCMTLVIAH